ncbi:hypothetical protein [Neobacillus terrae]|uniref:hypothetical protein n=1 Tax=Neobacillus terrae TaxID=3034837 RepID=UPI0014091807|nr:hypothetical protein [Neobacillus terrae]NHM30030.1 hypothetical protein [Neobacillus terrae]
MMKKLLVVLMSISIILSLYQYPPKAKAATTPTAYQQFSQNLSRDLNSYIKKSGGDIRLQYSDLSNGDEYKLTTQLEW